MFKVPNFKYIIRYLKRFQVRNLAHTIGVLVRNQYVNLKKLASHMKVRNLHVDLIK